MPDSVQNTFAVDFAHALVTRADKIGQFNLPTINTASFGSNSVRFNALNSWNTLQSTLSDKGRKEKVKLVLVDYFDLKKLLKKHFISSYKQQICI